MIGRLIASAVVVLVPGFIGHLVIFGALWGVSPAIVLFPVGVMGVIVCSVAIGVLWWLGPKDKPVKTTAD